MNDKSFPWNYKIVFQLPPDMYFSTLNIRVTEPAPDVEAKLESMKEYTDALEVINKIKAL